MVYRGNVVAFREGLSRLSYDETSFACGNPDCSNQVNQLLTIPGEAIGRPGKFYRVLRCLNCIFWGPYYTYFDAAGMPTRVEFTVGQCHDFLNGQGRNPASLIWSPGGPLADYDGEQTLAGGEPEWVQEPDDAVCPSCHRPMEFILQLSSMTLDGTRDEHGSNVFPSRWPQQIGYDFSMALEYYATLFFFVCEDCRITCSLTQCT